MRSITVFPFTNPSGKKVWKADVLIGTKPNGSPRFKRVTGETKKEATERGHRVWLDAQQGVLAPEGRERFDSFAMRWLTQVKAPTVRESTVSDYRYKLDHFILPTFGHRPLNSITTADVSGWLTNLKDEGKANYTINASRQVLDAVMRDAVKNGYLAKNPVANTPKFRANRRTTVRVQKPWTKDEAQQVLDAIIDKPIELFVTLAVYLGLRKSEILGLKWSDFDIPAGVFTICRSVREISRYDAEGKRTTVVVEEDPKTATSRRTLVITRPVAEALMRHKARLEDTSSLTPDSWVIASRTGTVQRPGVIANQLNKILDDHGIRRIRIHDIRHSALVLALESGTPMEAVSQGAGHSRLDTTKAIYAPYVQPLADKFSNDLSSYLSSDRIDDQLRKLIDSEQTPQNPQNHWGWGKK